jgi:hypothetical protein
VHTSFIVACLKAFLVQTCILFGMSWTCRSDVATEVHRHVSVCISCFVMCTTCWMPHTLLGLTSLTLLGHRPSDSAEHFETVRNTAPSGVSVGRLLRMQVYVRIRWAQCGTELL